MIKPQQFDTIKDTLIKAYNAGFITMPVCPVGHPRYDYPEYQPDQPKHKLQGKIPALPNWSKIERTKLSDQQILDLYFYFCPKQDTYLPMNLGIRLQAHQLVVDVDTPSPSRPNKKGDISLRKLEHDLSLSLNQYSMMRVNSPSGGQHYYLSKDPSALIKKSHTDYPDIDFLSNGNYTIIPPSNHIHTNPTSHSNQYQWDSQILDPLASCPTDLLTKLKKSKRSKDLSLSPEELNELIDLPHNIELAIEYLKNKAPIAIENQNGNDTTYKVICTLGDLGISPRKCEELLIAHYNDRCDPPWLLEDLIDLIRHSKTYRNTPDGSKTREYKAKTIATSLTLPQEPSKPIDHQQEAKNDDLLLASIPSDGDDATLSRTERLWLHKWAAETEVRLVDGNPVWLPNNTRNSAIILGHHPSLNEDNKPPLMAYDEFSTNYMKLRPAPWDDKDYWDNFPHDFGVLWSDRDTYELQLHLACINDYPELGSFYNGYEVNIPNLRTAICLTSHRNNYHSVKRLLTTYKDQWDGLPRMSTWLNDIFNVPLTEYTQEVSTLIIMAIVVRVFDPGHKFDYMVVTESAQNIAKSSVWRELAMRDDWFTDASFDISDDKKVAEIVSGKLVVEFGEISDILKKTPEEVKRFLSAQTSRARPAYGHHTIESKRQNIFTGSSNRNDYATDDTGNRRLLPISIPNQDNSNAAGKARVLKMRSLVPQLYGEAMHQLDAIIKEQESKGEELKDYPLVLVSENAQRQALEEQEARLSGDDRKVRVQKFLDGILEGLHIPPHLPLIDGCVAECMASDIALVVFGTSTAIDSSKQKTLGRILTNMGWEKSRRRNKKLSPDGNLLTFYSRPLNQEQKKRIIGVYGENREPSNDMPQSNVTSIDSAKMT